MKVKRIISGILILSLVFGSVSIPTSIRVKALDNKNQAQNLRCNIEDVKLDRSQLGIDFSSTSKACNILGNNYPDTIGACNIGNEIVETQIKNTNYVIENPENAELDLLRDEVSLYNLDYSQKFVLDKSSGKYNLTEDEFGSKVGVDDWFYVKPKNGNSVTVQYTKLNNDTVTYDGFTITESNWRDNAIPILGDSGEIKFKLSKFNTSFTYSYCLVESQETIEQCQPRVIRGNIGDNIDIKSLFSGYSSIRIDEDTSYFYDGKSDIIGSVDLEPYSSKINCSGTTLKIGGYGRYYIPVVINSKINTYVLVYTNNIRPAVSLTTNNDCFETDYTSTVEQGVQNYVINSDSVFNAWSFGEDLSFHKHIYRYEDYYDYSDINLKSNDDLTTFEYSFIDTVNVRVCEDTSLSLSGVNKIKIIYDSSTPKIFVDNVNKEVKVSSAFTSLESVELFDFSAKSIFKDNINCIERTYKYSEILDGKPDGSYVIKVKSKNGKSNTDVLTIDTVACTVNFENNAVYNKEFKIIFTDSAVTDGIKSIIRDSDEELKSNKEYGSIFSYAESEEGKHTYTVTDSIGNVKTFTLYIDFTAPNSGLSKESDGDYKYTYSGSSKSFTATDNNGISSITIDNKTTNINNKTKYRYTIQGYGRHKVSITDKAGNTVSFSVTLKISTIDAPNVKIRLLNKKVTLKKSKGKSKRVVLWKKYKISISNLKKLGSDFKYDIKIKYKYPVKKPNGKVTYKVGKTDNVVLSGNSTKKVKSVKLFSKKGYKKVTVTYRVRNNNGVTGDWSKATTKSLK